MSQILSLNIREVNLCNLMHWEHGSWDVPLHTESWILSLKGDMKAYMATFFGDKVWDLGWGLGLAFLFHPTLNTSLERLCTK